MTALPKPKMTLEEYFELDRNAEGRFEYFDGEVFELSGGTPQHSQLISKATWLLGGNLYPKGCFMFSADVRLKVPALPPYRYADISALCGAPVYEEISNLPCLTNPVLIVEVLSESTEAFDRDGKFRGYKSIPSFLEYVLIAQKETRITKYLKQAERFWLQSEYGAGEVVPLESLGCELEMNALYQGINFASETGF